MTILLHLSELPLAFAPVDVATRGDVRAARRQRRRIHCGPVFLRHTRIRLSETSSIRASPDYLSVRCELVSDVEGFMCYLVIALGILLWICPLVLVTCELPGVVESAAAPSSRATLAGARGFDRRGLAPPPPPLTASLGG